MRAGFQLRPDPVLLFATAVGATLRWHGINGLELQYDEAATGYFAALPWADLWGAPAVLEPNPPLFYSLARLVVLAGGDVEQVRWVSALAGTLCIPVGWRVGRLLAGRFAAGAAAWLIATSPQNIAFSQYARAYAVLGLCLLCAFLCLVHARLTVNRRTGAAWWACYAVVSATSLYLHHTAIIVLAALAGAALATSIGDGVAGRRFRVGLFGMNGVVALAYLPWVPVLVQQAAPAMPAVPAAIAQGASLLPRFVTAVQRPFPFDGQPWVNLGLLPFVVLGGWRLRATRDAVMLVACGVGGPALLFFASQLRPMLDGKTLAWAGLFLTASAALGVLACGRLRWVALVAALLPQAWMDATRFQVTANREGWRMVAALLRDRAEPQDAVFVSDAGAILALRHYGWPEAKLDIRILAKPAAEPWFREAPGTFAAGPGTLDAASRTGRTWLLTYNAPSRHAMLARNAERMSRRLLDIEAGKLDMSLFSPNDR